ncbi:MAG: class F sortase [Streptosporangiaceae bacterium]|nr:class F sortase [Streptosporangiaceae bacterium]
MQAGRLAAAVAFAVGLAVTATGAAGLLVTRHPTAVARPAAAIVLPAPAGPVAAPPRPSGPRPVARPVTLTIPAIGVQTPLVSLGLAVDGTLQVPPTAAVAGWYTGGPRPGAIGPAVIAGHIDSRAGPGVFFRLAELHPGDRVYVRRADGTLAVFRVTSVQMYPKDSFPTQAVYGPTPDAELRLITCGGTFAAARGSYLSNVVVYATQQPHNQ